ncbi:MAG: hypothetical protein ACFFFH_13500 [Candidatus Thorarchaeota archaeon]
MKYKNIKGLTYLAGIYAIFFFAIGIIGLFSLLFNLFSFIIIVKDPIEPFLLILAAIVYFRGFLKLKNKDGTGTAFVFVAAIMGIILGGLAFLNLIVNSGLGTFLREFSLIDAYNRIIRDFSFIIVIGILSLLPFKFIQSIEQNLVGI